MKTRYYFCALFVACFNFASCKKFLDAKSNQSLSTPSTLSDLQTILDNAYEINRGVGLTNIAADEYYISNNDFQGLQVQTEKDGYIWYPQTDGYDDWFLQYNTVFQANTVLDNLRNINDQGQTYNSIKGSALFFRAHGFYQIAQLFAKQYDKTSAQNDLGIPLRLNSNFNEQSIRSSLQQTYDQVILDINKSLSLLPNVPLHKTRPGRPSAFGLLARTFLTMGDYSKAKQYADSCLNLDSTLIDYNSLDLSLNDPIPIFNPEVLFFINTNSPNILYNFIAKIDSNIYNSYSPNDLRRDVFFVDNGDGTYSYKTSYNGASYLFFNGIGTDEIYLIRAECYARAGNTNAALKDLNSLLVNRYKQGFFIPINASNSQEALNFILNERKKELLFRGLRWTDIRRLNKEGANISLKRVVNGQIYILPPNDLRYTFLIPPSVIGFNPNMPQNPR
jgi:starch-binding outer membrane protein, SusD/RagB family